MPFLKLTDQNVNGKTVLIRADLNVPFKDGKISDDTRIRASLPSIQYCLDNGAAVIVMTHLGRPTEGEFRAEDDVAPVAVRLAELLDRDITVLNNWRTRKPNLKAGEVALLQNVRVNKGEKKNDPELRGYFDGSGIGRAGQSPEKPRPSAGGDCGGQQSVHQIDDFGIAGGQGGSFNRGRRHRQHFLAGAGQSHWQIACRA